MLTNFVTEQFEHFSGLWKQDRAMAHATRSSMAAIRHLIDDRDILMFGLYSLSPKIT